MVSDIRVAFTPNLARHIDVSDLSVNGSTVREVLDAAFEERPAARGYVLDDQNRIRKHVVIFVDGQPVADRNDLSDKVTAGAEVFVMQALSGG